MIFFMVRSQWYFGWRESGTTKLTFSNVLISGEESTHVEFACCFHQKSEDNISPETNAKTVLDAVAVEKMFLSDAFASNLLGANYDRMQAST